MMLTVAGRNRIEMPFLEITLDESCGASPISSRSGSTFARGHAMPIVAG
jgi:hypothetical protein